jgi:hypothetical protein
MNKIPMGRKAISLSYYYHVEFDRPRTDLLKPFLVIVFTDFFGDESVLSPMDHTHAVLGPHLLRWLKPLFDGG